MQSIAEAELIRACGIIYGPARTVDGDFLRALDVSCLKSAYRRRALATHPDLVARESPEVQRRYADSFQEATRCYRMLCDYLKRRPRRSAFSDAMQKVRWNGFRPRASRSNAAASAAARASDDPNSNGFDRGGTLRRRHMPPWKMRFGEYLFFSGKITWDQLIKAICQQKRDRPRLGDVAKRWGWISEEQIRQLLQERLQGERIGELFLRKKVMTSFRLGMLLSHQRRNSRKLGDYFVRRGLLTPEDVSSCLMAQCLHNRRFAHKAAPQAS